MFDLERQLLCLVLHESLFLPALQTSLYHHHRHYRRYLGSDYPVDNNPYGKKQSTMDGEQIQESALLESRETTTNDKGTRSSGYANGEGTYVGGIEETKGGPDERNAQWRKEAVPVRAAPHGEFVSTVAGGASRPAGASVVSMVASDVCSKSSGIASDRSDQVVCDTRYCFPLVPCHV